MLLPLRLLQEARYCRSCRNTRGVRSCGDESSHGAGTWKKRGPRRLAAAPEAQVSIGEQQSGDLVAPAGRENRCTRPFAFPVHQGIGHSRDRPLDFAGLQDALEALQVFLDLLSRLLAKELRNHSAELPA